MAAASKVPRSPPKARRAGSRRRDADCEAMVPSAHHPVHHCITTFAGA
jgi:hypothetical protein